MRFRLPLEGHHLSAPPVPTPPSPTPGLSATLRGAGASLVLGALLGVRGSFPGASFPAHSQAVLWAARLLPPPSPPRQTPGCSPSDHGIHGCQRRQGKQEKQNARRVAPLCARHPDATSPGLLRVWDRVVSISGDGHRAPRGARGGPDRSRRDGGCVSREPGRRRLPRSRARSYRPPRPRLRAGLGSRLCVPWAPGGCPGEGARGQGIPRGAPCGPGPWDPRAPAAGLGPPPRRGARC